MVLGERLCELCLDTVVGGNVVRTEVGIIDGVVGDSTTVVVCCTVVGALVLFIQTTVAGWAVLRFTHCTASVLLIDVTGCAVCKSGKQQ